jgi:dihydroneopterin aldolase
VTPPQRAVEIRLAGLEAPCHVGVTDEERRAPQTLLVDLRLTPLLGSDYAADDVGETVDYGVLGRLAVATAAERPYRLLERLATEIADRVWAAAELAELHVLVRKPSPGSLPAAWAGAEVSYRR